MYKAVEKTCQQCNTLYLGSKNRKYCGYNCAKLARKRRVTLICQQCNKEFEVQEWNKDAKYCSKECNYKNYSSEILDITCDYCKTIFKRKSHKIRKTNFCCKLCADKFNVGINHYEWKEHLHDKNLKLALKQWSSIVKQRDNYTCQLCGETNRQILEAHHVKHRCNFPELQFSFDNGITLCLDCHALQHMDDEKSLRLIKSKINKIKNS